MVLSRLKPQFLIIIIRPNIIQLMGLQILCFSRIQLGTHSFFLVVIDKQLHLHLHQLLEFYLP